MTGPINPPPAIILVNPQLAGNIGQAARAMKNFCLDDLRLVRPPPNWQKPAAGRATASAEGIIEAAAVHETLEEALAGLQYVLGASARRREAPKPEIRPEQAAANLAAHARSGLRTGLLFGPERAGLSNRQTDFCDALVMIPANPDFPSLNLAQAVLVMGYVWFGASAAAAASPPPGPPALPAPGSKAEMAGLFQHLEGELDARNFFHPPEKRERMIRNLRTLLQRAAPGSAEIRALRGVVTALSRPRRPHSRH